MNKEKNRVKNIKKADNQSSFTSFIYGEEKKTWLKRIFKITFWAYITGGFLAGAVLCQGCENEPMGRFFVSLLVGILSIFSFGFPPANEANVGASLNAWPYIGLCWIVFFVAWMIFFYRVRHKKKRK